MYFLRVDCRAVIARSEVNLIHRPACVCSPILSRMCFGSLSSAPLKNENAHDSLSGMTMATFFLRKVKQGLPHLSSSVRSQSSAIFLSLSDSFCHFFAKGTFMVSAFSACTGTHSILARMQDPWAREPSFLERFGESPLTLAHERGRPKNKEWRFPPCATNLHNQTMT